jgi:hypothetical protein
MTGEIIYRRFRGAHHHDFAALIAPIRSQINDPVGTADHIKVVHDNQDRIALFNKPLITSINLCTS